jgi:hypothetical protein
MSLNLDFSNVETKIEEPTKGKLTLDLESVNTDEQDTSTSTITNGSSLALNLEAIAIKEDEEAVLADFEIEESSIDRIIAAIGAGFATESVINARIIDRLESATEDNGVINESRGLLKTVVRKGKLTKKVVCPEGFRVKDGNCTRMSSKDAITYARRAKKAAKTRSRRKVSSATVKMRNRSILVRKRNDAKVNRVTSV